MGDRIAGTPSSPKVSLNHLTNVIDILLRDGTVQTHSLDSGLKYFFVCMQAYDHKSGVAWQHPGQHEHYQGYPYQSRKKICDPPTNIKYEFQTKFPYDFVALKTPNLNKSQGAWEVQHVYPSPSCLFPSQSNCARMDCSFASYTAHSKRSVPCTFRRS